jgi:HEAT repeat protein/beta-lactamase regulating signal transducer with metallopeptidase domain
MTAVETLGWILLHFAWQGALAAAVLWTGLLLTSPRRASLRYVLGCVALLLMAAAPLATAMHLHTPRAASLEVTTAATVDLIGSPPAEVSMAATGRSADRRLAVSALPVRRSIRDVAQTVLPWLVTGWALGVSLLSVRLLGGWWQTRRLRSEAVSPVPPSCTEAISRLTTRLRIGRTVSFGVSLLVSAPLVIGHMKPLILVPVAALSGLSPRQLEAILAHELAHIRRHDYLVNLVQTVIETVLFYHPAVWWVSNQVRILREHCCDDLAVAACGDRKDYVEALLGLEHLRRQSPLLALGATDGPLFARARRLLMDVDSDAASPRLAAGVIALTVAVLAVAGVSTASQAVAPPGPPNRTSQPAAAVAVSPQSGSLAERWTWAEREARSRRTARFWIGYSIQPLPTLPPLVYFDRDAMITGDRMTFGGYILGGGKNLVFPGRPLHLPATDTSAIKVLLAFDAGQGSARLTRVHASVAPLPVDLKDLPVFWLGAAETAQSLERVNLLYAQASTANLKKDLLATAAVHDDSVRVVAWLEQRITGSDTDEIRSDAAEWLARHPIKAALAALDRTARSDRSSRVRQEAAEAVGDLDMPEATGTLIRLAQTLDDREARREAVEALGARNDLTARDALGDIARRDPSLDIQREAVETLGDYDDQRGVPLLLDIARTHPVRDVQREAVETLGDALPGDAAVPVLEQIALEGNDADVQREAVETLSRVPEKSGGSTLTELAQSHSNSDVRREAVEALAQSASSSDQARVIKLLSELAANDRERAVQMEAVEALGEMSDARALEEVRRLARTHVNADVRRQALETLAEQIPATEAVSVLRQAIEGDLDADVRSDAVERLAELDDARARATLVELARSHKDVDVRAAAVESLGDAPTAQDTPAVLAGIVQRDAADRVRREAIETLSDLPDGQGIASLIEIARSHADAQIRRLALEALVDSDHPAARKLFDRALGRNDR